MENKILIHTYYDHEYISGRAEIICIYDNQASRIMEFSYIEYPRSEEAIKEATEKAIKFCKTFKLKYEFSNKGVYDLNEEIRNEK